MTTPSPVWTWSVGDWRVGPTVALATATTRTVSVKLLDPSEVSITLPGDATEATAITDLVSDVWVERNGADIFRGRVVSSADDIQETTYNVTATAQDYRGVLDRRLLLDGDRTWTGVPQETIAGNLIDYTQGKSGGTLGITHGSTFGSWPATGINRTITFRDGDSIWNCIKSLTAMQNGFEFVIDSELVAQLYWPRRSGVDNGAVLDYGGAVRTASGTTDLSGYANVVRQSGGAPTGTSTPPTPVVLAEADIATRPEGRWEANYGDTSLTTNQMVTDSAAYNVARYGDRLNTSWRLTLAPGAWHGPSHIWVGDVVTYAVSRGRRDVVDKSRVYEIDISLDQSDNETVTIVVGQLIPGERAVIKRMANRLMYLSKQ